jgi:hypothetical protein
MSTAAAATSLTTAPKQSNAKHVLAVIGEAFKNFLFGTENVAIAELPVAEKYVPGATSIFSSLLKTQISMQEKYAAVKGDTGAKKAAEVIGITFEGAAEIAANFGVTLTKEKYAEANEAVLAFQKAFTVPGSLTAAPTEASLAAAESAAGPAASTAGPAPVTFSSSQA